MTMLQRLIFSDDRAKFDGRYMLKLDLPEIRETIRLLKNLTNNVNQMAKSLHEQGSIYETEIDDIRHRVEEIWNIFRKILARLDHADK